MLGGEDRTMNTYASFGWTEAERRDVRNYQKDDVLVFHADTEKIRKGEYLTVEEQKPEGIVVRNEAGQKFKFDPKTDDAFDVGLFRPIEIAVGERLLIRANLKEEKLYNGQIVEVAGFKRDGSLVLKDKRIIPAQFRQFTYG
jgi:hypothetical protein